MGQRQIARGGRVHVRKREDQERAVGGGEKGRMALIRSTEEEQNTDNKQYLNTNKIIHCFFIFLLTYIYFIDL